MRIVRQYTSLTPHVIFIIPLFGVPLFRILEVQIKREIWKILLHFETKKIQRCPYTRAPARVAASNFGAKLYFISLLALYKSVLSRLTNVIVLRFVVFLL